MTAMSEAIESATDCEDGAEIVADEVTVRKEQEGDVIPREPKVVDTPVVLVKAEGRFVTNQVFMERVWPGTFGEEGSLSR